MNKPFTKTDFERILNDLYPDHPYRYGSHLRKTNPDKFNTRYQAYKLQLQEVHALHNQIAASKQEDE